MKSLLNLILERFDYERLLEEGKDPVEFLHSKYGDTVPSDIIDEVISIDPTKKKSYSQWLLSHWDDESGIIKSNLKNGRIEKLFQYFHERNDVQLKAFTSVERVLDSFVPYEDTVLTKEKGDETYVMNLGEKVPSELANDFDILFNQDDWIIATPNTYEASCKLGENMIWCTANAYGNGKYHYNNYLDNHGGKYYVNFDMSHGQTVNGKDYPYTRYQFHFETNQFRDWHNDQVRLDEIGMPESAVEFYESIGYDIDAYLNVSDDDDDEGQNEEEAYEEWRGEYAYHIDDGLYLCIEYNYDLNPVNVNEDTPFYLFDENDSTDPIIYSKIPNPHTNDDVVLYNNGYLRILRLKDEIDKVLVVNGSGGYGYRQWDAEIINRNYLELPDGYGIVGVTSEGRISYFSDEETIIIKHLNAKGLSDMFINEDCFDNDEEGYYEFYVETVINGYHSLFGIVNDNTSTDMELLVYKDIPQNGKYFELDENGVVHGKIKNYRITGDNEYDDEEDGFYRFDFEDKLENGFYLVGDTRIGDGERIFNIFNPTTKKLVSDDWFDLYFGLKCGAFVFRGTSKDKYSFNRDFFLFSQDGEPLGEYGKINTIDERGFIVGAKSKNDEVLINVPQKKIIGPFQHIYGDNPINNKILILDRDGYTTFFYDYIEDKRCFEELERPFPLSTDIKEYSHLFVTHHDEGGVETRSLFDLNSEKIVLSGLKGLRQVYMHTSDGNKASYGLIKVIKLNDKVNLFSTRECKELLPGDVDNITDKVYGFDYIEYELNDKRYLYNYKLNKIVTNQSGFDKSIKAEYFSILNNFEAFRAKFNNGRAVLHFDVYENGDFRFFDAIAPTMTIRNQNDIGKDAEAARMYYDITGQYPNNNQQQVQQQETPSEEPANSFSESIKRFMKRIDEVNKVRWNDIID